MNSACEFCLMDNTATGFKRVDNGCTFCHDMSTKSVYDAKVHNLDKLVTKIKSENKSKRYDCLIGLSGGVDSSYVLHKAIELGLRPLVIHVDNGWNTALSQHNIEKLIIGTNVTYLSEILYWPEYRNHLRALIESNVVDLELLADNIMNKVNLETAIKYGIKYILNGVNTSTEGIALPQNWGWNKLDGLNLRSILDRHSASNMRHIQPILPSNFYIRKKFYGIHNIPFLNYLNFSKERALDELKIKYNFFPYKYKHYENVFTRFYQGYILPKKFKIDKRKMHLSALVVSGEMSRQQALSILETDPYPSQNLLLRDKKFVLKKLGLTQDYFCNYMKTPENSHQNYKTNIHTLRRIKDFLKLEAGFNN